MSLPAMILAAGFGTRMGALVADRPKPLLSVAGRTLLDHALDVALGENCTPIVVNAHYKAGQIRRYLSAHHPDILLSEERPVILESGGGVKRALPDLKGDTIVTLNADAVWQGPNPIQVLRAAWDPARMSALLLLVPLSRAVGRQGGGDFSMESDGRLGWSKTAEGRVYTGAQILQTEPIAAHPDAVFSLREIWNAWMDAGRLYGVVYPGHWADVGHPAGLALAEGMLRDA